MSYFVIELCSIGGCPLEEASEHYSNKIIAILCSGYLFFAYSVFWVSFLRIFSVRYYLQVKKHNKWYQSTFQGSVGSPNFSEFFFWLETCSGVFKPRDLSLSA